MGLEHQRRLDQLAPDNGGVTVFSDHLEGYALGENIGWIRLGTHEGGGSHTYANDAAGTYGVNNDGMGNLSGYAWGANVGWINFDPDGAERVTIDPVTGDFNGYAWGENVGWIHFRNGSPAYKVNTTWRGALTAVTDLRASKSGVNVALTWSDTGGGVDHYEVWRSSAPYFAPIPAEGSLIAPNVLHVGDPISFTDETSHLGNPDINDYYVVLAVSASGQKSLVSNRVGVFDFRLQPGTGP